MPCCASARGRRWLRSSKPLTSERLIGLVGALFGVIAGALGLVAGTARRTRRTAQQAYEITQTVTGSRRDRMAQRAAAAELRPTVAEDPLRAQNRALSAFAVLLLVALLVVVVWQTGGEDKPELPVGVAGAWPQAGENTPIPDGDLSDADSD